MSVDSVSKGLACKELIRLLWRVIENTKASAKAQADWDRIEVGELVELMRPLWVAIGIEPGLSIGDKTLFEPFDGRTILITLPGAKIAFGSQSYWLKIVDPDTGTLRYLKLKRDQDDSRAASADNVSDLMHVAEAWIHWIEGHFGDRLAEPVSDEIEADDRDAIGSAALNAVVAGGLAGVLQAAVGARSVDRVTAIIRERVAADFRLYDRRADDWAAELRATKKTVTDSTGWREIMQWRAANKADRVSKKTGK